MEAIFYRQGDVYRSNVLTGREGEVKWSNPAGTKGKMFHCYCVSRCSIVIVLALHLYMCMHIYTAHVHACTAHSILLPVASRA